MQLLRPSQCLGRISDKRTLARYRSTVLHNSLVEEGVIVGRFFCGSSLFRPEGHAAKRYFPHARMERQLQNLALGRSLGWGRALHYIEQFCDVIDQGKPT